TAGKNILLIGGGVGINPLASIITQIQDYRKNIGGESFRSCLMFSAKTIAELLFKDSFDKFAMEDNNFTVQYFVTSEDKNLKNIGRITKADVESCLMNNLQVRIGTEEANEKTLVYVCGPPPMIEDVQDILKSLAIENLLLEKW
ncbi:Oxidoreductase NAD-binding domain-containing protein 1, partial [Pseudolycoriella hygida]